MLYLVGTPIGNLKDITLRALEVLRSVDIIACEDTRHSAPFLASYDIHKPLISYHKFNEREQSERIIEELKAGKNIALITDAGMPCISDPGAILVEELVKAGLDYQVVPGPSAVISALTLAGISSGYTFIGFLNDKNKLMDAQIEPFIHSPLPLVLYCGSHDLDKYREYLLKKLGDRPLYVVKEITKLYEGVERTTLEKGISSDSRGEFVLIVGGATDNPLLELSPKEHLLKYIELGLSKKEAIKKVADERGVRRDDIYKIALDI